MHARKFLTGLAASSVALAGLALTAGPATAAGSTVDPDDTTGSPTAAALTGVGSDTSQHAVKVVGDAYNATNPSAPIFSYSATGGGTVSLANGTNITRPNGSGAGKTLLYGSSDNPQVQFARSSSAESTAEVSAGLQSFPFALDTLISVVSGNVTSNAPTNITPAQLVTIYNCTATTWTAVGGTSPATIKPLIPQAGSGTRTFFQAQLVAANGGNPVNIGGCVSEVQEHDATPIANDANAIAPFSEGRANLATAGTLKLRNETGFRADRALYNVVRGADVSKASVLAAFGTSGYFCSPAAKPYIEASGFKQLRAPNQGGACGAPTQGATSNFATDSIATSTAVTVASASASSARVTARVSASSAPNGSVSFFEGSNLVQANVPLSSGQAVITPNATPGTHTYRAVYSPIANSAFIGSEGTGTGTVAKATGAVSGTFAKATLKGGKAKSKGTVTVNLTGSSAKASGAVTVSYKGKTVGTGTLSGGTAKVTVKLAKLKKAGKYKVTLAWAGDANGSAATGTATVKVTAAKKKTKK